MDKIKAVIIAITSAVMSFLGVLAIPVLMLVGCNIIDYFTGIIASKYRGENISSYKGMRGIVKKVCMWLLILIGAWIDTLIQYAVSNAGLDIQLTFLVAIVVSVWLVVNEIISILENMIDIGVDMPPFLMPLVKRIKKATEEKASVDEEDTADV